MKNLKKEIENLLKNKKGEDLIPFIDLIFFLREKNHKDIKNVDYNYDFCKDNIYVKVIEEFDDEEIEWNYCYNKEEIVKNIFRDILIYFEYFTQKDYNKLTYLFYNKEVFVKDEIIDFIKNYVK